MAHRSTRPRRYGRLYRRFILLTMICSLVPLLFADWSICVHYSRFARERILHMFQTRVNHHRGMIALFLRENLYLLILNNAIEVQKGKGSGTGFTLCFPLALSLG